MEGRLIPRQKSPIPRAQRPRAYLTTAELAARWNLTEGHLRNRRVAGRAPPYFKDKRIVRYCLEDIEAYEDDNTINSTTEKK